MNRVRLDTALGPLWLDLGPAGIRGLGWPAPTDLPEAGPGFQCLADFLDGRGPFPLLPVDLTGLPPFHQSVYRILLDTRPGQVLTYAAVAFLAGNPLAARAVGQAVKRNPLPILVPCHRVVAHRGPGGYSFVGGLELKQRLLDLESAWSPGREQTLPIRWEGPVG